MSSSTGKRPAVPPSSSPAPAAKAPRLEASPSVHRSGRGVQWHGCVGALKSLLHATYGQSHASPKVAAFALDHTLVRPKELGSYFKSPIDWEWWTEDNRVKDKLRSLHNDGRALFRRASAALALTHEPARRFAIVLFASLTSPSTEWLDEFKLRVHYILHDLDVPVRIFTSLAYDPYRKPAPAAWFEFVQNWNAGKEIDMATSFFIGGAAGIAGSRWDYDRKFAANVQLAFHTPAEYFEGNPTSTDWKWSRWLARNYEHNVPLFSPTNKALVPKPLTEWHDPTYEVILFVGPPGCGKTHLWKSRFEGKGYVRVTSPDPCDDLRMLLMAKPPVSVIVDTLLPRRSQRHALIRYVEVCSRAKHRVRAFVWTASEELAKHNLVYDWLYGDGEEMKRWVSEEGYRRWYGSWEAPDDSEGALPRPLSIKAINSKFDTAYWGAEGAARFKHWRTQFLGCYPPSPIKPP
ncbi:hypothetical protein JCM3770_001398 [Rhodotorula araucariae]